MGPRSLTHAIWLTDLFSTVGADLANEIPSRNNLSHLDCVTKSRNTFELKTTNYSDMFSLLTKLSKSKATGLDKIPARLTKKCSDQIASSLCSIFNRSVVSGIIPEEWKCSKVIHFSNKENAQIRIILSPNFRHAYCG